MITVKIDEEDLLDMLVNRVEHWTDDSDVIKLYSKYYENMVYGGCFEDAELDIKSIVDNDYVNYLTVADREEYEKDRAEYLRDNIKNFIEENKDLYEEKEDFLAELKDKIEELKEEAPEFDDLETGENSLFNDRYNCIEAKTDDLVLIRY
jgi:hypothetical protein